MLAHFLLKIVTPEATGQKPETTGQTPWEARYQKPDTHGSLEAQKPRSIEAQKPIYL